MKYSSLQFKLNPSKVKYQFEKKQMFAASPVHAFSSRKSNCTPIFLQKNFFTTKQSNAGAHVSNETIIQKDVLIEKSMKIFDTLTAREKQTTLHAMEESLLDAIVMQQTSEMLASRFADRGKLLYSMGESEKAFEQFKAALRYNFQTAEIRQYSAIVLRALGREEEAAEYEHASDHQAETDGSIQTAPSLSSVRGC